jgi:hypothetical protein
MIRNSAHRTRLLLGLLGLALIIALAMRIGPHNVVERLSAVGPEIAWLVVPYVIGTVIGAFPWAWLLPRAARPSVSGVIKGRLAASGANALLPFFALAGEPARLLWQRPEQRAIGTAALLVDRVVYNCASAVFLLVGVVVGLLATPLPHSVAIVAALLGVVVFTGTLALGLGASRVGVGARLERLMKRFVPTGKANAAFGSTVDEGIRALLSGPRWPLVCGFLVHFIGRAALGAEIFVALWVLDVPVSIAAAFVLATVNVATAAVGSAFPGQLGVLEGGQAFVSSALGMDPSIGLAIVLLSRLRQLAFAPLTVALISTARAGQRAEPEPALPDRARRLLDAQR